MYEAPYLIDLLSASIYNLTCAHKNMRVPYMLPLGALIRDSSAVEQEAVNFEVAGSNPVPGAI